MSSGDNDSSDRRSLPPSVGGSGKSSQPDIIGVEETETKGGSTDESAVGDTGEYAGKGTVPLDTIDGEWTEFFPFDSPYKDQVDGIETYIDALDTYDNMVMEGACGTGKTLIGLTAGIHHVRDRDDPGYSRVLAVTPVKQQLKQFIEEMRTINRQLDSRGAVNTVVLRGQTDVLPYGYIDKQPFDEHSVTEKIDEIRRRVIDVIRFGSNVPLDWPDDMEPEAYSYSSYDWQNASDEASQMRDEYKYDPDRAEAVVRILQNKADETGEYLTVNGFESPYPDEIPHTREVADLTKCSNGQLPTQVQGKFDAFFAGFHANDRLPFWFNDAENSVMDAGNLLEYGVKNGVCPHQSMARLAQHAHVIIGNYYHVFDPQTRMLTDMKAGILDDETICVVDEAHNIEAEVRDILSHECGVRKMQRAANDIQTAIGYINRSMGEMPASETTGLTTNALNKTQDTTQDITGTPPYDSLGVDADYREVIEFINTVMNYLKRKGRSHIDDRFDKGWEWVAENHRDWLTDEEIGLEEPDEDGIDELTVMIEEDYGEDIWERVYLVTQAAGEIIDQVDPCERQGDCVGVGELFYQWKKSSHVEYYREIVLEQSYSEKPIDEGHQWTTEWRPVFQLYNCIPTQRLREYFSELGSTLLMSATLQPFDALIEATGVGECVSPADIEDKDKRAGIIRAGEAEQEEDVSFRDVTKRTYPLRFPPENRMSVTVDATKYTSRNRGDITTHRSQMSDTRSEYANLLETIARSRGNILIGMPSYSEAKWARDVLKQNGVDSQKNIVLDQSSSTEQTDETLNDFFGDENGVLITSIRGTITEGVDYDGDKLHTCAVFGIALLPPTNRQKAVEFAYDNGLSGVKSDLSGFEMTNKIPAVRKTRQAFGRVIRGDNEVGTRILVDSRYGYSSRGGVQKYLSEQETSEFSEIQPENLQQQLAFFWE